ncbi:hypothetical protein ABK905_20590 [Acerihabitans sp. KWT182]|uniref:Uncharacterized protein n=1 Tax=Acerihabitans sp. KWT182 TaxID=3157919 RepID=A0AAU7Q9P7_9GAMM
MDYPNPSIVSNIAWRLTAFILGSKKHHISDGVTTTPPVGAFIPIRRLSADSSGETVTLNLPNGCSVSCLPAQLMNVMQALSLC